MLSFSRRSMYLNKDNKQCNVFFLILSELARSPHLTSLVQWTNSQFCLRRTMPSTSPTKDVRILRHASWRSLKAWYLV